MNVGLACRRRVERNHAQVRYPHPLQGDTSQRTGLEQKSVSVSGGAARCPVIAINDRLAGTVTSERNPRGVNREGAGNEGDSLRKTHFHTGIIELHLRCWWR